MNRFYRIHEKCKKLKVLHGRSTGTQQVYTGICTQRPVIVLPAAVYAFEGFLMKQDLKIMLLGDLIHEIHDQRIMIYCKIYFFKNWRKLILIRCNFIMSCFNGNTQIHTFLLQITHKIEHSGRYRTKIMIIKLLPFCRSVS